MANTGHKTPTPPTQRLTVSSLLSPPEMKRSESFNSAVGSSVIHSSFSPSSFHRQSYKMGDLPANRDAYASPPISPMDPRATKDNADSASDAGVRDPQLFRSVDADSAMASDEPLFPPEVVHSIAQHMQSDAYANLASKPTREEYELVVSVSLVSKVHQRYRDDPKSWWERERGYDHIYGPQKQATRVEKKPQLKRLAPAPSGGIRKQRPAPIPRPEPVYRAPPKRTPRSRPRDSFDGSPPAVSPRPPRPATNRDDTDYNSLQDFSPPIETLPKGNSKILKADWKGQVLDLTNDPDRHLLHEAEINLASTLRLTCATYLCSKRRIFEARIHALRIGKEFRKTDAQQACKIDVNKASKLWQAYDKVGWFKPDFFRQYLKTTST